MKMSVGVEWALHSCLELNWASPQLVPTTRLAALHELGATYLNKQLQALVKAGIVTSTSGPRGGFTLARDPADITVLDVVEAVEGSAHAFRCTEIRQKGPLAASPEACARPCQIASVMYKAEAAWRRELAAVTVAEIAGTVRRDIPGVDTGVHEWLTRA
ncbi:MAG: RrF2 family transcriptional regulator [Marmoricola sp.]